MAVNRPGPPPAASVVHLLADLNFFQHGNLGLLSSVFVGSLGLLALRRCFSARWVGLVLPQRHRQAQPDRGNRAARVHPDPGRGHRHRRPDVDGTRRSRATSRAINARRSAAVALLGCGHWRRLRDGQAAHLCRQARLRRSLLGQSSVACPWQRPAGSLGATAGETPAWLAGQGRWGLQRRSSPARWPTRAPPTGSPPPPRQCSGWPRRRSCFVSVLEIVGQSGRSPRRAGGECPRRRGRPGQRASRADVRRAVRLSGSPPSGHLPTPTDRQRRSSTASRPTVTRS